jgi:hypothetical protein
MNATYAARESPSTEAANSIPGSIHRLRLPSAHSKNQARSAKAARNVDNSWFGYASSISDSSVITFQKQFHLKLRNTAIRKNVAMKSMPVAINAWW